MTSTPGALTACTKGPEPTSVDVTVAATNPLQGERQADMLTKYKETARGGLAVNIVEC